MRVLLGLGGNTGDVFTALASASRHLAGRFRLIATSSVWQTEPQGPPQGDYLNAALEIESDVHPLQVLASCKHLETMAGRQPGARWGPRILDIDLLMADELVMAGPALTLPHPRFCERRFVLLPASEVSPSWRHPRCHLTVAELLAACDPAGQRCTRIGPLPPFP